MPRCRVLMLNLPIVAGCSSSAVAETERPEAADVVSRTRVDEAGELIVAAHYSGGGAGDTTYRLLACPVQSRVCDVMGAVDTHDGPPPEIVMRGQSVSFLFSRDDTIWDLTNLTTYFGRGPARRVAFAYR